MRGGALFINSIQSVFTLTNNIFIDNTAKLAKAGYTYTSMGFNIGPNYYGKDDSSRKGQFYYQKTSGIMITCLTDLLPDFMKQTDGYEQKVTTWFNSPLEIFYNNFTVKDYGPSIGERLKAATREFLDILEYNPALNLSIKLLRTIAGDSEVSWDKYTAVFNKIGDLGFKIIGPNASIKLAQVGIKIANVATAVVDVFSRIFK